MKNKLMMEKMKMKTKMRKKSGNIISLSCMQFHCP